MTYASRARTRRMVWRMSDGVASIKTAFFSSEIFHQHTSSIKSQSLSTAPFLTRPSLSSLLQTSSTLLNHSKVCILHNIQTQTKQLFNLFGSTDKVIQHAAFIHHHAGSHLCRSPCWRTSRWSSLRITPIGPSAIGHPSIRNATTSPRLGQTNWQTSRPSPKRHSTDWLSSFWCPNWSASLLSIARQSYDLSFTLWNIVNSRFRFCLGFASGILRS